MKTLSSVETYLQDFHQHTFVPVPAWPTMRRLTLPSRHASRSRR
jgi:hypothetical protein